MSDFLINDLVIAFAAKKDLPNVLRLMQQLAEFEDYINDFNVDLAYLEKHLCKQDSAKQDSAKQAFEVLVARQAGSAVGMLVFYTLPFTYDLKPWFMMKELIVDPTHRSSGVGKALMSRLATVGAARGVSKIRWDVLKANADAKRFYELLGAEHQADWELYSLGKKAMGELSNL